MSYTRKNQNADLRSYYPLIFEGGIIVVLLIMLLLTNINLGERPEEAHFIIDNELVELDDIVTTLQTDISELPPRPVVPQEPPVATIIEDEITDLDLTIEIAKTEKFIPASDNQPTTVAGTDHDTIILNPVVDLNITANYKNASFSFDTPERPVLPGEIPLDVIIEDPVIGLQAITGLRSVSWLAPPHPTVPAKIPVDIIIKDPVTDFDIQMDSGNKPHIPALLLFQNKYAIFTW